MYIPTTNSHPLPQAVPPKIGDNCLTGVVNSNCFLAISNQMSTSSMEICKCGNRCLMYVIGTDDTGLQTCSGVIQMPPRLHR